MLSIYYDHSDPETWVEVNEEVPVVRAWCEQNMIKALFIGASQGYHGRIWRCWRIDDPAQRTMFTLRWGSI